MNPNQRDSCDTERTPCFVSPNPAATRLPNSLHFKRRRNSRIRKAACHSDRRRAAIPKEGIAGWIDAPIRVEWSGARRGPKRRDIDSQADRSAIRKLVVQPGKLPVGIAFIVGDEFVIADRTALVRPPIYPARPVIRGVAKELQQLRLCPNMDAAIGWPFTDDVVVTDAHTHRGQWSRQNQFA